MDDFPNENLCFLIISDGGSYVSPGSINDLQEAYDRARKSGCWTCSVCLYIHVEG